MPDINPDASPVREAPPQREAPPEKTPPPAEDVAPPPPPPTDTYTPSPEMAETRTPDDGPPEAVAQPYDPRDADGGAHEATIPNLGAWLPGAQPEEETWWQSAQSTMSSATRSAQSTLANVTESAQAAVTSATQGTQSTLDNMSESARAAVTNTVQSAQSTLTDVTESARAAVTNTVQSAQSTFSDVTESSQAAVTSATQSAQSTLTSVTESARTQMANLSQSVQNAWEAAPEPVRKVADEAAQRLEQLEEAARSGNPLAVNGTYSRWTGEALTWTGERMHDMANWVDAQDRANPYAEATGLSRMNGMAVAGLEFTADALQGVGSLVEYSGKVQQGDPEALRQAGDVYGALSYLEGRGYQAAGNVLNSAGLTPVGDLMEQRGQRGMSMASPEVQHAVDQGLSAFGYASGREQELKGQALQWVGEQTGLNFLSSTGSTLATTGRAMQEAAAPDEAVRNGVNLVYGAGQEFLGRGAAQIPLQATQDLATTLRQGKEGNPLVDAIDARLNEYQERPNFAITRDAGRAALEIGTLVAGPEALVGHAGKGLKVGNQAARGLQALREGEGVLSTARLARQTEAGLTTARQGQAAMTGARDVEGAVTAARQAEAGLAAAREGEAALTVARQAEEAVTPLARALDEAQTPRLGLDAREAETPWARALDPGQAQTPVAQSARDLMTRVFNDPNAPRLQPRPEFDLEDALRNSPQNYQQMVEVANRRLGAGEGQRILELGPYGNTELAAQLGERNLYVGADFNRAAAVAQQRALDEAGGLGSALVSDTYHLPFQDGSMDSVLALSHNPFYRSSPQDKIAALEQVARVLKPDGEFIVGPWLRGVNPPEVEQALARQFDLVERVGMGTMGDLERELLVLRKAGVREVEPRSVGRPPDVRPDDMKLNERDSYLMDIPGMGQVMAKDDAGRFTRAQGEVLASMIDSRLPRVPGGSERIVPDTVPVRLASPASGQGVTAPAGLYSAQRWVEGAQEFQAVRNAGQASSTFLPDDIRMRYLDKLTGNPDRHPGNWLVDPSGGVHAIDNGFSVPLDIQGTRPRIDPLHDEYLKDEWMGERKFQGVEQGAERAFLEQSLEYARRAQAELTDPVINGMAERLQQMFPHKDLSQYADLLRHNRDSIPTLLEQQLARRF